MYYLPVQKERLLLKCGLSKSQEVKGITDQVFSDLKEQRPVEELLTNALILKHHGYRTNLVPGKGNQSAIVDVCKEKLGELYVENNEPLSKLTKGQLKIWLLLKKLPYLSEIRDSDVEYLEKVQQLRATLWLMYEQAKDPNVEVR